MRCSARSWVSPLLRVLALSAPQLVDLAWRRSGCRWRSSIPIVLLVSSSRLGEWFAQNRHLRDAQRDRIPDDLLLRAGELQRAHQGRRVGAFPRPGAWTRCCWPPRSRSCETQADKQEHVASIAKLQLEHMLKRALRVGPAALTDAERKALSADADMLRTLHREAWRHWPVESWQLARHVPQLPTDDETPPLRASLPSIIPVPNA